MKFKLGEEVSRLRKQRFRDFQGCFGDCLGNALKRQACVVCLSAPIPSLCSFWHVARLLGVSDRWSVSLVTENHRPCLCFDHPSCFDLTGLTSELYMRIKYRSALDGQNHEGWVIWRRKSHCNIIRNISKCSICILKIFMAIVCRRVIIYNRTIRRSWWVCLGYLRLSPSCHLWVFPLHRCLWLVH